MLQRIMYTVHGLGSETWMSQREHTALWLNVFMPFVCTNNSNTKRRRMHINAGVLQVYQFFLKHLISKCKETKTNQDDKHRHG